jgi:hypothetical protein
MVVELDSAGVALGTGGWLGGHLSYTLGAGSRPTHRPPAGGQLGRGPHEWIVLVAATTG